MLQKLECLNLEGAPITNIPPSFLLQTSVDPIRSLLLTRCVIFNSSSSETISKQRMTPVGLICEQSSLYSTPPPYCSYHDEHPSYRLKLFLCGDEQSACSQVVTKLTGRSKKRATPSLPLQISKWSCEPSFKRRTSGTKAIQFRYEEGSS